MRLLCELFLAAVLIWFGWEKSFHATINQWRGIPETTTATTQATTAGAAANGTTQPASRPPTVVYRPPPSTPSGQWMCDPGHRGTLDAPATKAGAAPPPVGAQSATYWIDGNGVRHYTNAPPPSGP